MHNATLHVKPLAIVSDNHLLLCAAVTAWSGITTLPVSQQMIVCWFFPYSQPVTAPLLRDCVMQEPTQRSFHELLQQLKKDNRHDMTVLLLGEASVLTPDQ